MRSHILAALAALSLAGGLAGCGQGSDAGADASVSVTAASSVRNGAWARLGEVNWSGRPELVRLPLLPMRATYIGLEAPANCAPRALAVSAVIDSPWNPSHGRRVPLALVEQWSAGWYVKAAYTYDGLTGAQTVRGLELSLAPVHLYGAPCRVSVYGKL